MKVEIFSDVVCPWCYIGKRRFEAALAEFEHADDVDVTWRSYELDPGATPTVDGLSYAERLGRKYGQSPAQAEKMLKTMTDTAATVGLDFHFEKAIHANTFAAHQLVHYAKTQSPNTHGPDTHGPDMHGPDTHGLQAAMKERLMQAYFTEGADVADVEVLVKLGTEVGLQAEATRAALTSGQHGEDVRADEAQASAFGITGVPFFVIDRKFGVSGAQPPAALLNALQRAWAESHPLVMVAAAGDDGEGASRGATCAADGSGCAV